jgi:hypothetical protein
MAFDAFIKFDGVEGEAVDGRLHRDFRALGADFAGLGGDFIKLVDDLSAQRGASIAQDLKVEHDLLKIDGDFLKVSASFLKLDSDFLKFGDGLSNFVENELGIKFTEGPSLADSFHNIDTDFQNTRNAFIKLGTEDFIKLTDPANPADVSNVGDDFLKISGDLKTTANDFVTLADNFIKITAWRSSIRFSSTLVTTCTRSATA